MVHFQVEYNYYTDHYTRPASKFSVEYGSTADSPVFYSSIATFSVKKSLRLLLIKGFSPPTPLHTHPHRAPAMLVSFRTRIQIQKRYPKMADLGDCCQRVTLHENPVLFKNISTPQSNNAVSAFQITNKQTTSF